MNQLFGFFHMKNFNSNSIRIIQDSFLTAITNVHVLSLIGLCKFQLNYYDISPIITVFSMFPPSVKIREEYIVSIGVFQLFNVNVQTLLDICLKHNNWNSAISFTKLSSCSSKR